MMIGCSTARILMVKRLHEALAPAEGRRLDQHLATCHACRRELAGETAFEEGLRRLARESAGRPSVAVDSARIIRHLQQARHRPPTVPHRGLRRTTAAVVCGLGLFAIYSLKDQRHGTTRGADTPGPATAHHSPGTQAPGSTKPPSGPSAFQPKRAPGARERPTAAHRLPRVVRSGSSVASPHPSLVSTPRNATALSDEHYLDGRDPRVTAAWMVGDGDDPQALAWLARLPRVKDDFVQIPLPRFASTKGEAATMGRALHQYELEAKKIDPRLFRKVSLRLKGNSLEEFCSALEKETGVRLRPSRGVADEKVTVFVEGVAARDLMRAVARLFGYFWSRAGAEGAYRYELFQDLKSQLAEEEMRNRDLDGAVLAVDTAMQAYLGDLDLPLEELRKKAERSTGAEKSRLETLLHGGWGMAKAYQHLSPADLAALMRGETLNFSTVSPTPERQLPAEWRPLLLGTGGQRELDPASGQFVEVGDLPDARAVISLRLKRSELGQVSLEGSAGVFSPSTGLGGGTPRTLAIGRSPATAGAENARANRALQTKAPFTSTVSFRPVPQCANLKFWHPFGTTFGSGTPNAGAMEAPQPHVDSAEVWEEVHRRSGLPIVADYYTRQFDLRQVTVDRAPLFEALSRVSDRMGVRWRQDGEFILGRSTSYFWDKLKEVPVRMVRRWQKEAREARGLPLRDLLEMAALSDQQLNSAVVAPGMRRCHGLEEWDIVGGEEARPLRVYARFLALLSPAQLNEALSPAGLPLTKLTPPQLHDWLRFQTLPPAEARLRVEYVPAGFYLWVPVVPRTRALALSYLDVIAGPDRDAVLAQARRHDLAATESQVRRSTGVLSIRITTPQAELFRLGKPPVLQSD